MAKQVKALNINDSVALESDMGSKLNQSAAAPEFLATEDYPSGYHVTRNGNLYRFTSDHPAGAWTGEDVTLEDMTTPDAMLDLTSAGLLRVVSADGTIVWSQPDPQPLAGQTMPESPTQRELATAVKLMFAALGGTITPSETT